MLRKVPRLIVAGLHDVAVACAAMRIATLVLDIEPMVARWGTSHHVLSDNVMAATSHLFGAVGTLRSLAFVTNSARRLPGSPAAGVILLGRAHKPWRTSWARDLSRPLAVAGDTVLTDGVLAARLGGIFLHYSRPPGWPWWPRQQAWLGSPLVPLLFTTTLAVTDEHP